MASLFTQSVILPHVWLVLQENPDLPDRPDAWLYKVWDSTVEEQEETEERQEQIELSGELENDAVAQFMAGHDEVDTTFVAFRTAAPAAPKDGKALAFPKAKRLPCPKPKPQPVQTPEAKALAQGKALVKQLGSCVSEARELVIARLLCQ